jgi:hypothetical protein
MTAVSEAETCGDLDCVICHPMVTRSGHVVTPEELEQWAEEAGTGYVLSKLREL